MIFFVVMFASLYVADSFGESVMKRYGLYGGSPGDAPPWYFITRDFADGFGAVIALSISLVAAVATWRWWPTYAAMMVWMALLWHGGAIAQSWIIHQSCPGLIDGQRITTRWLTYDSYLHDAGIDRIKTLIRWSAVLLAVALPLADRFIRRSLNRNTP